MILTLVFIGHGYILYNFLIVQSLFQKYSHFCKKIIQDCVISHNYD